MKCPLPKHELERLYKEFGSLNRLCHHLKVGYDTLTHWMDEYDIPINRQGSPKKNRDQVNNLFKKK